MPQLTARNKFSIPLESDAPADLQAAFEGFMGSGGDHVVQYDTGPANQRPVSTPAAPGKLGRRYVATDDLSGGPNGTEYIDTGTGWILAPSAINNLAVTNGKLADNSVDARVLADGAVDTPAIQDANVSTAKLAPKAVDTTKLADALKPSAGAGAATEALRALGTGAGQALPGNDASVTNARTPTAHRASHAIGGADSLFGVGLLAAMPAAGTVVNGYLYFATDDNGGTVYQCQAGAWVRVSAGVSVPAGRLAADVYAQWQDVVQVGIYNWGPNDTSLHILQVDRNNTTLYGVSGSSHSTFTLDPNDYQTGGRSAYFRLKWRQHTGNVAPGFGITIYLHEAAIIAGATNPGVNSGTLRITTAGQALTGSTAYRGVSGAVNLGTDREYAISAGNNTGPWPAGASVAMEVRLQVRAQ